MIVCICLSLNGTVAVKHEKGRRVGKHRMYKIPLRVKKGPEEI